MFCKNCGAELDDDALFCEKCGQKIKKRSDAGAQVEKVSTAEEKEVVSVSDPDSETVKENLVEKVSEPQGSQEVAKQALETVSAGVGSSKPGSSKKTFILIGVLVAAAAVVGLIVFFSGGDKRTYSRAQAALEEGNIEEAKALFEEISDYEDSAEYIENLTSKISGVSDKAYYMGMKLVDKYYSDDYRSNLQSRISVFAENSLIDNWESDMTSGEVKDEIRRSEMAQEVKDEIGAIIGDGNQDKEFANLIFGFYDLIFDNSWARELGDPGDECSANFSVSLLLIGAKNDSGIDFETAQKLTDLKADIIAEYKMIQSADSLDDVSSLKLLPIITIGYISENGF